MRRILVLRGGALGDFIVTLPTLEWLRRRWPQAHIELVGNATAAQLALARGWLDGVHSQHDARWSALFAAPETPLAGELAAWLASFDLVLNYWPDPDGDLARRFPLHSQQTFLTAAALPTSAPAAAHYAAPLRALGLELAKPFTVLEPLAPRHVDARSPRPIVLHPGSGSPRKNWPLAAWRELARQLPAPLQVVLGAVEMERWPDAATNWPTAEIVTAPPLEDLVALLASARVFLGHDSGVSHLAAACGAPCVLLFGPTDPAMWAPPVPQVHVVSAPDLTQLAVAELQRIIASVLEQAR